MCEQGLFKSVSSEKWEIFKHKIERGVLFAGRILMYEYIHKQIEILFIIIYGDYPSLMWYLDQDFRVYTSLEDLKSYGYF